MAEFDWVTARANCSLGLMFERLKGEIEEDVKKRQEIRPKTEFGNYYGFRVDMNQSRISVLLEGNGIQRQSIVFYLKKDCIEIVDGSATSKFKATATLCDDGECRLKVNDQERELWQVRKLALEDLFFNVVD